MVDEQQPPEDDGTSAAPPGPRRSTFTPPPEDAQYDPSATDDDALAGALADDFRRWSPPQQSAPSASSPFSAPEPAPPPPVTPAIPVPPRRESMTDEQLLAAADLDAPDHDTSALLDLLEQQLRMRESEVAQLSEWETQVRATAGADAEPLVAEVRAQFTGSIPVVRPTATPEVQPAAPVEEPPVPAEEPPAPAEEPPAPPARVESAPPPQSDPELDLALADAPPPFGAAAANVPPPPGSAPAEDAPPPLVEPETLPPLDPEAVTASTSLESLFGVSAGAEDVDDEAGEVLDSSTLAETPAYVAPETDETGESHLAEVTEHASPTPSPDDVAAALGFNDLLRDPEPDADGDVGAESAAGMATATTLPPATEPLDEAEAQTDGVVPTNPSAARVELVGPEPTPAEQRAGASVRLFWLWFAVNASVVSLGLGAVILTLGMSLRQAILATLVGVAVSFLPLGLGTLAGKWSGQPTMIVSRATFGLVGNILPALVALVSRALWASALLWMLAAGIAEILIGGEVLTALGRLELTLIAAGLGLALAALVAGFGFAMIAVVSAVVSALAAILVVGIILLTVEYVDLALALSVPDGSWGLMVTGAILVFSVVGLAWANSSGDVARYQAKGTVGAAAVLWATFGATVPSFLLISWGAVLAASNPVIAEGLVENPVDLISRLLPLWYPAPLIAAVALSLIAAAALALYSGGFALQAVGARLSRPLSVLIVVVLSGALLAALVLVVTDLDVLFRDVVTTLAVPIAAWAGIFGAETMIRSQRVHAPSLLRSGGVYPAIRWVNVVMFLVTTALGWGLTTATVVGLEWQGYLWPYVGLAADDVLLTSDLGVVVALVLGLLVPIVAGIPSVRKLQAAEREATGTNDSSTGVTAAIGPGVGHSA
jgi:purine-cytosine permease-like protein